MILVTPSKVMPLPGEGPRADVFSAGPGGTGGTDDPRRHLR
jgi:hypothetical protein